MNLKNPFFATVVVLILAVLFTSPALSAQDSAAAANGIVPVVVTARVKRGAAVTLSARDVLVHEDKNPRPVTSFEPVAQTDLPIQLMILIDSNASPRLGAQFQDISHFIQSLPQSAQVGLAYTMSGSARIEQPFTSDRAAIGKALHITFGAAAGNTSVYSALSDLIEKWPGESDFREVLLISDGIDPTYGFFNTQPDQNPGLQKAIRDAQKFRITVFSIFVSSGRITRNQILNLNGQGSLNELTSSTGGYSFTQGTQTPVSFRPFLDELQEMLVHQYLLTFQSIASSKPGFHDLKVGTETSGVELSAPKRVYVPAVK